MSSPDSPEQLRQNETASDAFPWDSASTDAVSLLADDRLTDLQIAKKVGISRATLGRWKQHPEFKAKVSDLTAELMDRARRRGLARLDRRMERYEKRAKALDLIVRERSKAMPEVPGGRSGYMVRQFKSIGTGEFAHEVEEYHFDAALSREMGNLEKQIAQDTGQWSEKREISGPDGGPIPITSIEVVLDDLGTT